MEPVSKAESMLDVSLDDEKKVIEKKKKRRPARRQVEGRERTGELMPPQTGQVFNVSIQFCLMLFMRVFCV